MDRIIVKRIKGRELSDTLRSMKVGDIMIIKEKEFRSTSVFNACYKLNKKGFKFDCSAKKNIDGSRVERLRRNHGVFNKLF